MEKCTNSIKPVLITIVIMSVLGGMLIYDITKPEPEPKFNGAYAENKQMGKTVLNINEGSNEYVCYWENEGSGDYKQVKGTFEKKNDNVIQLTSGELKDGIVFLRDDGVEYYGRLIPNDDVLLISLDKISENPGELGESMVEE